MKKNYKMKNTLFVLLAMVFSVGIMTAQVKVPTTESIAVAQENKVPGEGPVMQFESMVVDYGTIEQHSEPLRTLKFVNTGTTPLVITNARGSCGCTVPTWAKEPIMPGEESTIEIRYATNRLGKINKKVTITTNEGTEAHVINVVGDIFEKETEESVPAAKGTLGGGGK